MGRSGLPSPWGDLQATSREVFPHFGCGCELLGRKRGRKTRTPAFGISVSRPREGTAGGRHGGRREESGHQLNTAVLSREARTKVQPWSQAMWHRALLQPWGSDVGTGGAGGRSGGRRVCQGQSAEKAGWEWKQREGETWKGQWAREEGRLQRKDGCRREKM